MDNFIVPAYRILTPRLCLRCWQPKDAAALKTAVDESREHLIPWMPWAKEETTLRAQVDRLRRVRAQFDLGEDFIYGIFSRDEKQVLGSSGLHTRVGTLAREIGYWVHVDHILDRLLDALWHNGLYNAPLARPDLDESDGLEHGQGLPQRGTADLELLGQFLLGGQAVTGLQAAREDDPLDLLNDLLGYLDVLLDGGDEVLHD